MCPTHVNRDVINLKKFPKFLRLSEGLGRSPSDRSLNAPRCDIYYFENIPNRFYDRSCMSFLRASRGASLNTVYIITFIVYIEKYFVFRHIIIHIILYSPLNTFYFNNVKL